MRPTTLPYHNNLQSFRHLCIEDEKLIPSKHGKKIWSERVKIECMFISCSPFTRDNEVIGCSRNRPRAEDDFIPGNDQTSNAYFCKGTTMGHLKMAILNLVSGASGFLKTIFGQFSLKLRGNAS